MLKTLKITFSAGTLALLGACGDSDLERATTGALMGGAAAAVTGENVGNGMLIGGAIGGASCTVANNC